MSDAVGPDLTLISFVEDRDVRGIVELSSRLSRNLRDRDRSASLRPDELSVAARQVQEMHVADLVRDVADGERAASMVFHVAESLAGANPGAAWQGLIGVPAALALNLSGHAPLELPLAIATRGPRSGWLLLRPLVLASEPSGAWLPHGHTLVALDEAPPRGPSTGLVGFPHGAVTTIDSGVERGCRSFSLTAVAHERLLHVSYALLSGLLSGTLLRLVEEAYLYARIRQSAGKPINHHQAVMLRLAELALRQQGVALYLQATVERHREIGCQEGVPAVNAEYITRCTGRITEDTVQVAAGHGYVEGLPFKSLFAQARTLASAVALLLESASEGAEVSARPSRSAQ